MKRHEEDPPLDAEERALAAQLRRLPPHGEPTSELDARILAMARTASGGRRPAPWYRRLPGYASAAAVCVLAAGLAWQLWPAHVQRSERTTTPASVPPPPKPVSDVIPAPPKEIVMPPAADSAAEATVAASAQDNEAPTARAPQQPRPAPPRNEAPATPQPSTIPSTGEVSAYSTTPATVAPAAVAPAPAPPAPPAPPPPPPPAPPAPAMEPAASVAVPAINAMRAQKTADTEDGYDARPPATVQDANVRTDWLKRIRELMAQGDRTGARSSLQEYKTRYPDATIPADLQPLLAPPPAKTP